MQTSTDFRNSHTILYHARILQPENMQLGDLPSAPDNFRDIIDLRGNGTIDHKVTQHLTPGVVVFGTNTVTAEEPGLGVSLGALTQQATEKGTEVLTQEDTVDPGTILHQADYPIEYHGLGDYDAFHPSKRPEPEPKVLYLTAPTCDFYKGETSTLGAIRDRLTPDLHDAGWAIDVARNEFLVYRPLPTSAGRPVGVATTALEPENARSTRHGLPTQRLRAGFGQQ